MLLSRPSDSAIRLLATFSSAKVLISDTGADTDASCPEVEAAGGRAPRSAQVLYPSRQTKDGCSSITGHYDLQRLCLQHGCGDTRQDDPSIVKYRAADYLLTPEKIYETSGFVPNVVFPCATLHDAETGRIAIYYGAADTYVALAFTQVDEVVGFIKNNSEIVYGDDIEYK